MPEGDKIMKRLQIEQRQPLQQHITLSSNENAMQQSVIQLPTIQNVEDQTCPQLIQKHHEIVRVSIFS